MVLEEEVFFLYNLKTFYSMRIKLFCLSLLLLVSCAEKKISREDLYTLVPSTQIKSFELNSDVKYNAFYLYVFNDKNKEYLSFLNYYGNQILFYDLNSGQFLFKIDLDQEGPHGIVQPSGCYVKDFDNIYVSSYAYKGLIKVDTTGQIIQRIPFGKTKEGYEVLPSYTPSSHPYTAPLFVEGKMFITQPAVNRFHPIEETPLSIAIDTIKSEYIESTLSYSILNVDEMASKDLRFGRIFNNGNFIYSFYASENLIIASGDHSSVQKIGIPSKYINSSTEMQKMGENGPKSNLEVARYGDIIYDSYRKVYYRFAYPKTELEHEVNWRGKAVYGRKKFSVIILNEDFEIIGETLFPESVYNSYVFFVHKDGLYISRDYQMNYDQSEDFMTFELIELVKTGK